MLRLSCHVYALCVRVGSGAVPMQRCRSDGWALHVRCESSAVALLRATLESVPACMLCMVG